LKLQHFWRNNQKKSNFSNISGDNLIFFLASHFYLGEDLFVAGGRHIPYSLFKIRSAKYYSLVTNGNYKKRF